MTNTPAILRTLTIYAICVVLAIWLGFLLAGPLTYSSLLIYGILAFILFVPILLRWHYPLLLLSWYMYALVFFLPGQPAVVLPMIVLSLGISIIQRTISRGSQFIRAPQITLPLLCIIGVVVFTAKMTGVGLHVFGSNIYGGRKYFYLVAGILGYFALSAKRIPPTRRNLYLALFFLGGLTAIIGDLVVLLPRSAYFIYYFFNFNTYALRQQEIQDIGLNTTRFTGMVGASVAICSFMMARYGLRGIFLSGKPWRWIILLLALSCTLLGGFRGILINLTLLFALQFFLEGLHRTKLLPILLSIGFFGALALIPLTPHLPFSIQRALSFLPYKVSTAAKLDAQQSMDWRVKMWQAILPEVPNYLLLGKGYVISPLDYEFVMGADASIHSTFAQNDPMALAEDFHNGPLSIVIPFGIWGCLAFLWFAGAAVRVLYLNYRYSAPDLKTINSFLLAAFVVNLMLFLFAGGAFADDMLKYCGFLGLSVALNAGVRRPVRASEPAREAGQPHSFVPMPTPPSPAFQRRLPGASR